MATKPLTRSRTNRVVAGVAGGIGGYFSVDPTIVRILFVALTLWGGSGVLLYIVLWILVPEAGQENVPLEARAEQAGTEIKDRAQSLAHGWQGPNRLSGGVVLGIVLIIVGISSLGSSLLPWHLFRWDWFWPLLLVALGVMIMTRRK